MGCDLNKAIYFMNESSKLIKYINTLGTNQMSYDILCEQVNQKIDKLCPICGLNLSQCEGHIKW